MAAKSNTWSFADVVLFVAFWAGILAYREYADPLWNLFFVAPAISQAETLEAQGRLPEAIDILTAQAKDNPQNAQLLWALGDYYTKADSPLLAHFYFQALTHVDTTDLDPERVAFAKSYQGTETDAQHDLQRDVDDTKAKYQSLTNRPASVHPDSVNAMLNEPASKLDIGTGYFDPDYPISTPCSDGSRCQQALWYGNGNLWTAIATQHLAIADKYGGTDCCTLDLNDPDLRALNVVETEFLTKLQSLGDQYAPDSEAGTKADLAFRARILAKQRYVQGFLEGANVEVPPKTGRSWSELENSAMVVAWLGFLAFMRNAIGGRVTRWRETAAASVVATTRSTSSAARPRSEDAEGEAGFMPLWRRIAYFALAALLVLAGAGYLSDSAGTSLTGGDSVVVPTYFQGGAITMTSHLTTEEDRANGLNFAAGLSLVMAGFLALNRGSRRSRKGPGFIDNMIGRLSVGSRIWSWQIAAGASTLAAFVIFGSLYFGHTVTHWNTESAVTAFKTEVGPLDIYVNGDWIYGITSDGGTTHIAPFSPTLYRAMDRANINIGDLKYPFEFPLPGFLPILILIGLCAAALWRRGKSDASGLWTARCFLAFGLLQLYVVLWLLSAEEGLEISSGYNPDWIVAALFLLVSQLVLITSIYDRLRANVLPPSQQWAWIGVYFATSLAMLPWAYRFSGASLRAPALLWISLYLGFAALLWLLMTMRYGAKGAAS